MYVPYSYTERGMYVEGLKKNSGHTIYLIVIFFQSHFVA